MNALAQESLIVLYGSTLVHGIVSAIIIVVGYIQRTERTKFLPLLFGINLALFLAILFAGTNYLQLLPIDFVAFLGYSMIISYAITIEVPGFILLSKHDAKLVDILQNLREKSIQLNYNFESINDLRKHFNENEKILRSTVIIQLTDNFIKRCETIMNLDKSLYEVTIKEIGEQIQQISARSKHPFPKLIEIMSLAGISFLLGQFLNHFFP